MKRFLQIVVLAMLAIYNAIQTVTGGATVKRLVPTGVITQGILGGFSGKVGPVVGGKWKDIDYMRGYVVPSNPNTTGQQAVRAKFAALVDLARQLIPQILQPYWDKFYSSMSGFNAWISQNYSLADANGAIDENAIMAIGTLQGTTLSLNEYDTATGVVELDYSVEPGANGDENDPVVLVCYDSVGKQFFVADGEAVRSDGIATLTMTTGLTAANVFAYMFFRQGTGSALIVSDSVGAACTAA